MFLVTKVADIYSTFGVFAGEGYWVILFSILLVEGILFEGKASVSGLLHILRPGIRAMQNCQGTNRVSVVSVAVVPLCEEWSCENSSLNQSLGLWVHYYDLGSWGTEEAECHSSMGPEQQCAAVAWAQGVWCNDGMALGRVRGLAQDPEGRAQQNPLFSYYFLIMS